MRLRFKFSPTSIRLVTSRRLASPASARTLAVAPNGLSGAPVLVEAQVAPGLPAFHLVGLPDAALAESTNRVRAACQSLGISLPAARITVNLSPSALPKHGSGYDLPIAIAVLAAIGEINPSLVADVVHIGELGLNGVVRKVPGILPMLWVARDSGVKQAIVPNGNLSEAQLVSRLQSQGVQSLSQALGVHGSMREFPKVESDVQFSQPQLDAVGDLDFNQIIGQESELAAVALAATGGHNLALVGPPGTGKTMLAERIVTILPPLNSEEALLLAAIESLLGKFSGELDYRPRFEAPHHTASLPALIGGGSGQAKPGAISRAHLGVLFLDEATEFPTRHLDALRQPIESGYIEIGRVQGVVRYPSRFQLILAFNPCPCGHYSSPRKSCRCGSAARLRYLSRISGPMFDRVDIRLWVDPPDVIRATKVRAENSTELRKKVAEARERSQTRLAGYGARSNSELTLEQLRSDFALESKLLRPLIASLERGQISMRGLVRILRLAWTCADYFDLPKPDQYSLDLAISLHSDPLSSDEKSETNASRR